ncbi:MAG TPA: hypothetical protein VKA84_23465 [Gemmatimonadaceae bacterium]|nr:hypothetical protein [Gemmatimonadaceae bacterium]
MDHAAYQVYVRRAETAESVRDLHLIVQEVWRLHATDPQAEAIDRACWKRAEQIMAAQPLRPRAAAPPPPPAARPPDAGTVNVTDWKERAAGAEVAQRISTSMRIVK